MKECKIKIECYLTKEKQFELAIKDFKENEIDWLELYNDGLVPDSMVEGLLFKEILNIDNIEQPTTELLLKYLTKDNINKIDSNKVLLKDIVHEETLVKLFHDSVKPLDFDPSHCTVAEVIKGFRLGLMQRNTLIQKLLYLEGIKGDWEKISMSSGDLQYIQHESRSQLLSSNIPKEPKKQLNYYKYEIQELPNSYYVEDLYKEDVIAQYNKARKTLGYWFNSYTRSKWKIVLEQISK